MQTETKVSVFEGVNQSVEYLYQAYDNPKAVAVICHPHPLYQGSMHNKVVTTLAACFDQHNISHLRFNFRGVGKSLGSHDNGIGETQDTIALAHWLTTQYPSSPLILSGFSFGAYIALKASLYLPVKQLIAIAPAVSRYSDCPHNFPCPLTLVQGSNDEIIEPQTVEQWYHSIETPKHKIDIDTGHFFHGKLIELKKHVCDHLNNCLLSE